MGRLTDAAQLDDFNFYDLRHDFASKLLMARVDLNIIRELLGHADIKMTLRYVSPGKLAEAVANINKIGRTRWIQNSRNSLLDRSPLTLRFLTL